MALGVASFMHHTRYLTKGGRMKKPMYVANVSFSASKDYDVSRVEIQLNNGESVSVFIGTDGKISLCASNPNQHGEFINTKGTMVKVDHYSYPSD